MNGVIVTGMGAIGPVGQSSDACFDALLDGTSGVTALDLDERYPSRIGGQVNGLDASGVLGAKEARRHGRVTQIAAVAAAEALEQSGLASAHYDPRRIASIVGVGMGALEVVHENINLLEGRGPARVNPFAIPASIPNMPAAIVAMIANAQGPCYGTASACASSAHAIGHAAALIQAGIVDAAICGGAEACVNPVVLAGFGRMGALSERNGCPAAASRPFDTTRDGFVLAEGGAILVLEGEPGAARRGAPMLARVCGYGASSDAHHPTLPAPDGRGALCAMQTALQQAGIEPGALDYINAHGTSTPHNDDIEALAIASLLGDAASNVPVSSTKSMTGHMLGGAGAFEAVVSIKTIIRGAIPPTINLHSPSPDCRLDLVPNQARWAPVHYALSNSFAFGGQNATLLFGAFTTT